MKVYICGKITNLPGYLAQHYFSKVEEMLRTQGHEPLNPMNLPHNHSKSWEDYMRECIAALVQCDAIYLMGNWYDSKGANLEYTIANRLGMKIITEMDTYEGKSDSIANAPCEYFLYNERIYKGVISKSQTTPSFPARSGDMYIILPEMIGSGEIIDDLPWHTVMAGNIPAFIINGDYPDRLLLICKEDDSIGHASRWVLIISEGSRT